MIIVYCVNSCFPCLKDDNVTDNESCRQDIGSFMNAKIQTIGTPIRLDFACVRLTGLEPAQREPPDPKSGASTNSATGA